MEKINSDSISGEMAVIQCWTTFEPCFTSQNKKIYLKFIFYLFSETVSWIGFEAIFRQKIKNKYQNQKTFYKNTIGVYIYIFY